MDIAFTCVFMIEMAAKILALGLVAHKGSYLRNGWNILDGMIVIFSVITLIANASPRINAGKFKSLRSLRALRTFRPLRVISRRPGLRLVVNALIEAIPEVLNVMLLSMLLYLIFSIIAVNYLKGLLYACQGDVLSALSNDQQDILTNPIGNWTQLDDVQRGWFVNTTCDRFSTLSGKITSRYICECWGAEWSDVIYDNFNNVGNAMLTFFEISTTEGWSTVMIAAIDTTDIDMQPIRDNTEAWAWFFVLFIMVGSFFVVNLFVGVIIDNFNKMKAVLGDDFLRSPEQKRWIEAISKVSRVVPVRPTKRPKHKLRACLFDLVKTRRFEWFIIVCILINTVLMGAQDFGQPTKMTEIIDMINQAFAVVFTLEAVLKLMSFGRAYFNDVWNQFDWLVVLGTLLSIVIEAMTGMSVRSLAMLVRVLRVTRVVRLVKASKSVRQILLTLYIALPGLSNISSLLFLILFIYATMGIQFFAKAKHFDNIDSHANFQNFWNAFLFLLRAATGEAWHDCMHDLANTSDCVDDPPYNESMCGFNNFEGCIPINGCGSPIAFLYFCSFTLLVTYVMLNLTISVILEGFSQSQSQDDEPDEPLIEPEILDEFQLKWAEIDVNATGYIHIGKLRMLITLLEEPLGRKDVLTEKSAFIVYMRNLGLQMYDGNTIHFRDTLVAMARELVKETVSSDTDALDDLPISEQAHPSRLSMSYYAHEYCAVRVIEKCVRQWLRLKREFEQKSMEEYRSKIKKPAKRVRKRSNARVYTIM